MHRHVYVVDRHADPTIAMYVPRYQGGAGNNTYDINMQYSRPAKRAIPRGEEEDKEERRRSVLLPRSGRRLTARPSSLPVAMTPASEHQRSS